MLMAPLLTHNSSRQIHYTSNMHQFSFQLSTHSTFTLVLLVLFQECRHVNHHINKSLPSHREGFAFTDYPAILPHSRASVSHVRTTSTLPNWLRLTPRLAFVAAFLVQDPVPQISPGRLASTHCTSPPVNQHESTVRQLHEVRRIPGPHQPADRNGDLPPRPHLVIRPVNHDPCLNWIFLRAVLVLEIPLPPADGTDH